MKIKIKIGGGLLEDGYAESEGWYCGDVGMPAAPEVAKDADVADPGAVESVKAGERETKTGKYGSTPVKPYKKPETEEEKEAKPHWVEVVLKDEEGKPVPGAAYRVELPDGSVAEGTLNEKGMVRLDGVDQGNCQISFPDLHPDVWSEA